MIALDPVSIALAANNWILPGQAIGEDEFLERKLAYADFHGLQGVDEGNIDEAITDHAKLPRCSLPDLTLPEALVALESDERIPPGAQPQRGCRWPHRDIRFWQDMVWSGLTREQVQETWVKAAASWGLVCGISPVHVRTKAETNIYAHVGFTTPGVLAWSYLPCGFSERQQLRQQYSSSVNWARQGLVYLQEVMAHEIGHALGLSHLKVGNLMQPTASGRIIVPQQGDIAEARERYGPPIAAPTPPSPAPPSPPVPPPPGDPDQPPPPPGLTMLAQLTLESLDGGNYRWVLIRDR